MAGVRLLLHQQQGAENGQRQVLISAHSGGGKSQGEDRGGQPRGGSNIRQGSEGHMFQNALAQQAARSQGGSPQLRALFSGRRGKIFGLVWRGTLGVYSSGQGRRQHRRIQAGSWLNTQTLVRRCVAQIQSQWGGKKGKLRLKQGSDSISTLLLQQQQCRAGRGWVSTLENCAGKIALQRRSSCFFENQKGSEMGQVGSRKRG